MAYLSEILAFETKGIPAGAYTGINNKAAIVPNNENLFLVFNKKELI